MKRNEQLAAKKEALGAFYFVPGLFFGTHLSHAHSSCFSDLVACGSLLPQTHWAHPSLVTARLFPGHNQLWWHFPSPLPAGSRPDPVSVHVPRTGGGFHSWALCRRCPVALFKHCSEYTSAIGSFNAASTCREIKALSWLPGWITKDLAPTAILVSLTLSHGKATSIPHTRPFPLLRNCSIWGDFGGIRACSSCFLAHPFHHSMKRRTTWD